MVSISSSGCLAQQQQQQHPVTEQEAKGKSYLSDDACQAMSSVTAYMMCAALIAE
jgi:hypothetical protein